MADGENLMNNLYIFLLFFIVIIVQYMKRKKNNITIFIRNPITNIKYQVATISSVKGIFRLKETKSNNFKL
jgi:hypothetical protein